jgi:hypothetical protein
MTTPARVVGIDFDNTIVCFDTLFHRAAVEQSLIPADVPTSKTAVRDYLRRVGKEPAWTELQGYVYGVKIREAAPFPGVLEFVSRCRERGWTALVISHKTRHPFIGPRYDLHEAARKWLEDRGFAGAGLSPARIFLETTKEDKLRRIGKEGCRWFIDDLPEFLAESAFPKSATPVLFDPNEEHPGHGGAHRLKSWAEIGTLIL